MTDIKMDDPDLVDQWPSLLKYLPPDSAGSMIDRLYIRDGHIRLFMKSGNTLDIKTEMKPGFDGELYPKMVVYVNGYMRLTDW